jgi:hypothetical protein
MLNFDLMALRLRQYGAAWVLSFVLVAIAAAIAHFLLHMDLVSVINVLLLAAFAVIAVLVAVFLALTFTAGETGATKGALLGTAVVLAVPLLWAPVLGAVTSAFFAHVSIEYSSVYAAFRILIGKAVWAVLRLFSENPVIEAGMKLMEIFAAVVGFIASVSQLWEVLGKRRRAASEG